MRILYFDVDSLRPDHLGCYGYHRDTSPNIDRIAGEGIRFDSCYASDVPCLPSRTALITGRFGIHNGVVTHGGTAADPFVQGETRGFQSAIGGTSWTRRLRGVGIRSASISTFAERHSAFQWYSGFNEIHNVGKMGMEVADEVADVAIDWLQRNGREDDWLLHVNMWDPHTPYRTPAAYGDPFAKQLAPDWISDEVREHHWTLPGPHSSREVTGFDAHQAVADAFPRQPLQMSSMSQVRRMFDGYDAGVRYADEHIGRVLDALTELGVYGDTLVIVSADHGENLGELNIYGDHHTADEMTARVPLIVRGPGIAGGRVDRALHYQLDMAATVLELAGQRVPGTWDGRSFATALREAREDGRDVLVLSQAAWAVQRSVRFRVDAEEWLYVRTYHDAFHGYPDEMLFELASDPHEQHELSEQRPDVVANAARMLESWHVEQMAKSTTGIDPFDTVMDEGGGWHIRGRLDEYLERLRVTGREDWADQLVARYAAV